MHTQVAIIGGGITGLTIAHHLQTDAIDFRLVESCANLGGKISSLHQEGFMVEAGPDSFMTRKSAAMDLCRALGLQDELISTSSNRTVYLWNGKGLVPMPEGVMMLAPSRFGPFLKSPLISWAGKLRMGMELFVPARRDGGDESLASFVRRRLGDEVLEKIAGPLLAGIFSADPEKMSIESTFPMFSEMERKHGSLLRAMLRHRRNTPRKTADSEFLTLRAGLQQLVTAIERRLPAERLLMGRTAKSLSRKGNLFEIRLSDDTPIWADSVVFTTATNITANLLQELDPALAEELRKISYVSTATVSLGYRRSEIPHSLTGSGFVVAAGAQRRITACTWSSQKFAQRAPDGCALLRVFIGGARNSAMAELSEEQLITLAREELQIIMGISAAPLLAKTYRWPKANPQYNVGHKKLVAGIERLAAAHEGLYLAGAAFHGAGLPDCVASGNRTAGKIAAKLPSFEGAIK